MYFTNNIYMINVFPTEIRSLHVNQWIIDTEDSDGGAVI